MLTVFSGKGNGGKFCDGVSRRDFLKIGGLALGGLSLPGILRAEEQAGIKNSHKAIIMVFLAGGPPHQDMFDLKMDAPTGIRGEFKPIKTNVPGIEICEHLPRLARMMDKCTIIRSLVGARNEHNSYISLSGYSQAEFRQQNWPSMGAVLSYLRGPVDHRVPPFVGLQPINNGWGNSGEAGFVGRAHAPVRPINGRAIQDMLLKDISLGRLENRRKLLTTVDRFRKQVAESSEVVAGADNAVYMSRQGDFADWDFGADVEDSGRAVAFQLGEAAADVIDSPYREGNVLPGDVTGAGAKLRDLVISNYIEFFELMIPAKEQDE
ncbi:MAG: DUF1501 domain-containing protein [Chloroflexi bacterium]|nr:DUF1501 domain-containing protein [Chloroflexota bacterium]